MASISKSTLVEEQDFDNSEELKMHVEKKYLDLSTRLVVCWPVKNQNTVKTFPWLLLFLTKVF